MTIFTKDGRLMIPIRNRRRRTNVSEDGVRYVVNKAYCPKGCNVVDNDVEVNGLPGLRLAFQNTDGKGELVISAIEGDFDKVVLSGKLTKGQKNTVMCPHCHTPFKKLVNCNCNPNAEMVVLGLTPKLNFNNAITFCNITDCSNGSFIKSGEAILHVRLMA